MLSYANVNEENGFLVIHVIKIKKKISQISNYLT